MVRTRDRRLTARVPGSRASRLSGPTGSRWSSRWTRFDGEGGDRHINIKTCSRIAPLLSTQRTSLESRASPRPASSAQPPISAQLHDSVRHSQPLRPTVPSPSLGRAFPVSWVPLPFPLSEGRPRQTQNSDVMSIAARANRALSRQSNFYWRSGISPDASSPRLPLRERGSVSVPRRRARHVSELTLAVVSFVFQWGVAQERWNHSSHCRGPSR